LRGCSASSSSPHRLAIIPVSRVRYCIKLFITNSFDLGYSIFHSPLIVVFNSVNLTDGLDGLATFPVIIASLTFLLDLLPVGNAACRIPGIPHVLGRHELAIIAAASWGGVPAFL
jgi:phospho-N-acetylmuramoyl-pentapeptide-transferase